ncbi:hypothetical protein [Novosphingobium resinovorum]|uniref:hypothetical protein n=1 Tax=Novosphingobium resinovorum TaxID=158500 RepID=UPI002ED11665|nr:hypothetical protein [Novosphingobium resinovorum]
MRSSNLVLPALGALSLLLTGCGSDTPAETESSEAIAPGEGASSPEDPASSAPAPGIPASPSAVVGMGDTSGPISCAAEIGEAAAARLAAQCRAVSPATRPPCHVANSCAMIRNEVARSCAILAEDAARTPECGGIDPIGQAAAADMVERYYAAINARDYASAWSLWGPDGGAGGKTLSTFTQGFAETRRVHVEIGKVSEVEGGAGSLYVTVPVTIDAELAGGARQHFTGSYDLRQINRGMGVSQGWHIMSAKLRPQ